MKPLVRLLAAAAVAAPFLCACSSTSSPSGAKQAEAAASTMDDLRAALVKFQQDVEASSTSLNALVATREEPVQDAKQAYSTFAKSVSGVGSSASKASDRLAGLKKETQAYFAKWEKDSATITDASLKKSAAKRQQSMAEVLGDLDEEMLDVQKELDPFQKLLADVQTYLGNDLSPAGLESVEGKAKTVSKQAKSLVDQIADVIEELDSGASSFRGA